MKLFIDSANPEEIRESMNWGYVDGVTTNPSLAAKVGSSYKEIVAEILEMVSGPVSLEVVGTSFDEMLTQGRQLHELGKQVVVKLPCTREGIQTCKVLTEEDIQTNVTLVFSRKQALLAAKAGATYVSPFVGRLNDVAEFGGDQLIADLVTVYDDYDFSTKILAASIRDEGMLENMMVLGVDVVTVPFEILKGLADHSMTQDGLARFLRDWNEAGMKLPV